MPWAEVITPGERELFRRCRRAWDLGSARRRNLEPRAADPPALDAALREALAVYYYPGMWQWDRALVAARARQALEQKLTGADARSRARTTELFERYLDWAPTVDRFDPLQVNGEFDVTIPDPRRADTELASADGLPVRFRGFVDLLVLDGERRYWLLAHAIGDEPLDAAALAIDPQGSAACWAWQRCFLAQPIAGILYNDLCREGGFRRIAVARSAAEREQAASALAFEALDMLAPDLRLYPNFALVALPCLRLSPSVCRDRVGCRRGGDPRRGVSGATARAPARNVDLVARTRRAAARRPRAGPVSRERASSRSPRSPVEVRS